MSAQEPTTPDPPPAAGLPIAPPVDLAAPPAAGGAGAPGAMPGTFPPELPPLPERPPVPYHHGLRDTGGPWRGILALVLFGVVFFVLSLVFGLVGFGIEFLTGRLDPTDESSLETMTPVILLATNLSLAALIPVSMLLQRWLFGIRMGATSSIAGRFRWRWLGRVALVMVPVFLVYIGVTFALDPSGEVRFDGEVWLYLAIVLLTTPLQSAGEEYGFRGLIQRSVGSWFRSTRVALVVGAVVSSSLFALAHLAEDPWLIAYYFVFGLSATLSARHTGGLEAPVLIHALNNTLLFIPTVILGQMSQSFDRSAGTGGPFMLLPMAVVLGSALLTGWWARRHRLETVAPRPLTAKEERRERERAWWEQERQRQASLAAWSAPTGPAAPSA
ncbi:CPBP family intramembrane glutamic endopeptidase [Clavibacter michiganensis]|uniref:CPBP family intramembrane glutamic endopeptidase n=1 Tax=Clavibacter michiganensis TaxID=28447 RepID=UPI001D0B9B39|nr:CPBP family intramembrane glutamic endopeptidase [Clavibacter michiganensis]UDM21573.1 CPBP family intramembrane metalloprotease [Clavibacter michiganensis subsp. michiganensis]